MFYNFTKDESDKIIEHFGRPFYEKILKDIHTYTEKWQLEILQLVDYYSVNCVFICRSKLFGDVILKIGNPCKEVFTEANTLREYNGRRFCTVFDAVPDNGIILEEYIHPGTRLRNESSLEKRLSIFSELFNGLHIEPQNANVYPTYFDWVNKITHYMSNRDDYKELSAYMNKARDICSSLCITYPRKLLLHGDFHHDNILLDVDNKYRIIDPKGVIGDPIFDIPRFILNEFYEKEKISYDSYFNHINKVIVYFEKSLNIPSAVIKQCIFIETAMCHCWNVESNEKPDLDSVVYAEAVMNSN